MSPNPATTQNTKCLHPSPFAVADCRACGSVRERNLRRLAREQELIDSDVGVMSQWLQDHQAEVRNPETAPSFLPALSQPLHTAPD